MNSQFSDTDDPYRFARQSPIGEGWLSGESNYDAGAPGSPSGTPYAKGPTGTKGGGPGLGGVPGGSSANYGGTAATTGTTATYGGTTAATTGSAFDAANLGPGVAPVAASTGSSSAGVWANILKALGSTGASGYASAIKEYGPFILSLIAGLTQKHGTYEQQPESPQLTEARNRQLGYVENSPTRNMYASLIQQFLAGGGAGAWHSPAPMAGGQFYQSAGMSGADPAIAEYLRQVSQGLGGSGSQAPNGGFVPERDKVNYPDGR